MLWLIVLLLIATLSFVIFHRPPVNAMGAGWQPPRLDAQRPASFEDAVTLRLSRDGSATAEDAVTAPIVRQPAPELPDTFNFNDVFAQAPSDRPHV
jgi:hypothetical protein